ncbi:MAG: class I SAM-dependent methyltransferase [Methanomassiliicoccales archaeon]|nr:class I SAM-dependent methyltransferase [Methanomassiliicoccales archaeon]
MPRDIVTSEQQLKRQLSWLGETWQWVLRNKVLNGPDPFSGRPTALDVGCGPGLVMDLLSPLMDITGTDIDPMMVRKAKGRGLNVVQGDAMALPFDDRSFDIVYCSFTLLWVRDPAKAVEEMARVSRRYVICLAEPDYGGRICCPQEVAELDGHLTDSLIEEGADPFVGRKLTQLMKGAGLTVESGVHEGLWSSEQLMKEADAEWLSIADAVRGRASDAEVEKAKLAWDRGVADGSLFLFNPVLYAIGRKR